LKPSTREFYPSENNSGSLGTTNYKWANVYATTFNGDLIGDVTGDLSGNAATADKLKTTVSLWGNNFDGSSDISGNISLLGQLDLNRVEDAAYGRISYYKNTYHTWYTYMSNYTNGSAPTGGRPS